MNKTNTRKGEFTLNIEEKEVKLLFSMRFWRILDENGYKLEDLETALDGSKGIIGMINTLATIVYSGGIAYSLRNKTEFDYEIDEIFDWFEDSIDEDVMERLFKVLLDSQIFGKTISDGLGKTSPKKSTGKS